MIEFYSLVFCAQYLLHTHYNLCSVPFLLFLSLLSLLFFSAFFYYYYYYFFLGGGGGIFWDVEVIMHLVHYCESSS